MTAGRPLDREMLGSAAAGCAFLFAVSGFVSIAAAHLFLGLSLALFLASRTRLALPPVAWPLGVFLGWTLVSTLASDQPAAAFPQLKKFYVFLALPVVYTAFRTADAARRVFEAWAAVGLIAACVSFLQFAVRLRAASISGENFVEFYAPDRITGFFSHWMTFSQTALLIAAILVAYVLFGESSRRGRPIWIGAAALICAGLVLSFTRSVWLAMALLGVYFVAATRPRLLWAAPVAIVSVLALAPGPVRERIESIRSPGPTEARPLMWRTGLRMIQQSPLTGLGPERVGPRFREFLPPDAPAELPDAYYGHLHNQYIHYAAERGIPAALALVWLLGKVLWDMRRQLASLPPGRGDRRFLAHAGAVCTLAVGATGCFDLTLGDSEVLGAYLAAVALAYRCADG
jgi:putative inorganic carbon (hco3(-)) transporter